MEILTGKGMVSGLIHISDQILALKVDTPSAHQYHLSDLQIVSTPLQQ